MYMLGWKSTNNPPQSQHNDQKAFVETCMTITVGNSYGSNCNCVIILVCHACTCKIHHLNVFLQPNQLISFLNA